MTQRNRVTITLDEKTNKKIRDLQAKLITKTTDTWSFSSTVDLLVQEGLKSISK